MFAHWSTVRDHIEAWTFQLTTETETIEPKDNSGLVISMQSWPDGNGGHTLDLARLPVVIGAGFEDEFLRMLFSSSLGLQPAAPVPVEPGTSHTMLIDMGYRVLEQRFPRRAYVVIRDERDKVEQPAPPGFPRPGILLPPRLEEPVKLEEFEEY